jgi:hypothetical protein
MNQLPDTNNQGISDQSDNLPEIKTLMVNEMPTLIVQEDRYGGSYSNVNYLLFNDLNWRDENFDAGAYGEIMASGYNCRPLPQGYTSVELV